MMARTGKWWKASIILSILLVPLLALASQRIGKAPDYAEFNSNASLRFYGNATVWEDMRVKLESAKVPTVGNPDWDQFRNNTYAYHFDVGEVIYFSIQFPHSWKEGTVVEPHLHYSVYPAGNGTQYHQWQIEFTRSNVNGTFGATETLTANDNVGTAAYNHKLLDFGALSMANGTVSDIFMCRLSRQTPTGIPTGATDYPNEVFALEFDVHYQVDSLGSRTLYVK